MEQLKKLLKDLLIDVDDLKNFEIALTHKSFSNENKDFENYERLEFLGDAVWDLIIATALFKNKNKYSEGQMSKMKIKLVEEFACYEFALKLGLDKHIRLGVGQKQNDRKNKAILADIFESFVAATFTELGFNLTYDIFHRLIIEDIMFDEMEVEDHKSRLQELIHSEKRGGVVYKVLSEQGKSNEKWFVVGVELDGIIYGEGSGHSKQDAEKEAAKDALSKMRTK